MSCWYLSDRSPFGYHKAILITAFRIRIIKGAEIINQWRVDSNRRAVAAGTGKCELNARLDHSTHGDDSQYQG